jgi:hopanoid C-3 methylase
MKLLFVHPGPLLYTNVFLRLEPLGLELVAEAARRRKHSVRLIDLQGESPGAYHRMISEWLPNFIAFSCNYLANVPEIVVQLTRLSSSNLISPSARCEALSAPRL